MPKIKAIHQLVVDGLKAGQPSRVIEPGQIAEVSKEDADLLIERGAASAVAAAADDDKEVKKPAGGKKADDDGLV